MNIDRRTFLKVAASALPAAAYASPGAPVKLGVDLFSIRSAGLGPIEALDYCSKLGAKVVHFSEIRFIGSLEPANLRRVREHAEQLGIEVEIGMRSICPSSKMFEPKDGTAEEQLGRMVAAATVVGSKIVRAVLGSSDDRKTAPIERHIENTIRVLKNVRSRAMDANVRIAIENHAGDMQSQELRMLIEGAGRDFVGACLDSGNPLWTLEDPHVALETLAPYVLTSHVRDSAVWKTPDGAAVTWVRMGDGNVGIADYVHRFAQLCPGKPLSLEIIVFGPRKLAYRDPKFWDAYRDIPAWQFARFEALADGGEPRSDAPWDRPSEAAREKEDLEASFAWTRALLAREAAA
ncbi:MAG TPA: TIM barrel protein [Bryobacteraceae bacterium]|nr:TIM barrel protein [Bryobacteraceae bacterium]